MQKRVTNRKKAPKIITIIVLILLCDCVYCGICISRFGRNADTAGTQEPVSGGNVNFLITGTDLSESRTDTIMLISYNPKKSSLHMVSIPRDTMVTLNGKKAKINAANAYGGEGLLVSTVENLLGIDVNYYATVDYTGFDKIIDSIGGVNVTIPNNMNYEDDTQNLNIHFTKGENVHLDGKKAEEFFRWRENNDGTGLQNGDIGRIENQHMFVEKVIAKVKSPVGLLRAPLILNAASQNIKTNMKPLDILRYGFDIARVNKANIETTTLQGSTPYIGGVSYFVYEKDKNTELVSALKSDVSAEKLDMSTIKVEVLNCTGKDGIAAKYASKLKREGFTNVVAGNGKSLDASKIVVYGLDSSLKSTIKSKFGINKIETDASKNEKYDIVVMLGSDYKS